MLYAKFHAAEPVEHQKHFKRPEFMCIRGKALMMRNR